MDDGNIDLSNLCEAMANDPPASFLDDWLNTDADQLACTHTHTCNPPINDLAHHTHTCVHVHTKLLPASAAAAADTSESLPEGGLKKQRPAGSGNRAAVRKYREKKKAHTALLEEEVSHLKAANQQLVKKLQSHSSIEAEVARLRCLLVDIKGRIEGEIGTFPYQGSFLGGAQLMSSCDFRCNDRMYCNPGMQQQQQARTVDGDGVMSGHVLGQGAGDSMVCGNSGSLNPPGCNGGQML